MIQGEDWAGKASLEWQVLEGNVRDGKRSHSQGIRYLVFPINVPLDTAPRAKNARYGSV